MSSLSKIGFTICIFLLFTIAAKCIIMSLLANYLVKVGGQMNCEFPKIISNLRKSKGISQKQAAIDLGISQALLSHYEKGIRECGLDFLIKLSDYYEVSCDELLGVCAPVSTVPKDVLSSLKKIANEAEKILNNQSL